MTPALNSIKQRIQISGSKSVSFHPENGWMSDIQYGMHQSPSE